MKNETYTENGTYTEKQRLRRTGFFCRAGAVLLAFILAVPFFLSGCGKSGSPDENYITIRISMYNDVSYSDWRTYVEKQCPNINLIWENNRNSTQNLIYQAKHGDLADIVTIRRFESDSAAELAPYLYDLTAEKLTSGFDEAALEPFEYDGKICWYPEPGMMECLYANASLFEKNGIKIPETLEELENACRRFKALGIDGLKTEASAGFRSSFFLEGFSYSGFFSSNQGKAWLASFTSGKTEALPEEGCSGLTQLMRAFTDSSVLEAEDLNNIQADDLSAFYSDKCAMTVGGSDLIHTGKNETDYTVIPCLGETAEDQVLYTYPVFSTALSASVSENEEKKAAAMQVLQAMYSADAQKTLAEGADALMSYSKDIDLPVRSLFDPLSGLMKEKKCFMRFLNRNMFSADTSAVADALNNGASDETFSSVFNTALTRPLDTMTIGISNISAGNQLGEDYPLERPAASVIAQAVWEATGADVVLIEGKSAAAPIYKGSYSECDLNAAVAEDTLEESTLNGAQLQSIFDDAILATTTYRYGTIEPIIDYPALGGASAFLSADGTKNEIRLADGSTPDPDKTYRIVISGTVASALGYLRNQNLDSFSEIDTTLQSAVRLALTAGNLPAPVSYFKVEEEDSE